MSSNGLPLEGTTPFEEKHISDEKQKSNFKKKLFKADIIGVLLFLRTKVFSQVKFYQCFWVFISLENKRKGIKAEIRIGTQISISVVYERIGKAAKPMRREPIVEPMSNMVINIAKARGLSSELTLSLKRAVDGAILRPHPTPYSAITIASNIKF